MFVDSRCIEKMSTASFAYQMVPKMFRILRHLKCIMHRAAEAHHSELSRCSPEIVELPLPDQKMLAKASAGAKTVHQLYHLDSRSIQILFICRTTYIYIYVCMYMYVYVCICMYMYVCMYLCIYVSMYLCIYVSMYLCIYVCMYVCVYIYIL